MVAGRYRVKNELGRGGFGLVFRAADELERRDVALKIIQPGPGMGDISRPVTRTTRSSSAGNRSAAELLRDEFRILTQLHHPNLAVVYDFGRSEELNAVFFTQQLIEGPFIGEYLREASHEQIVDIMVQTARALDHLHVLGLLHEDLNLHNVLVTTGDGRPRAKIIDFGLARLLRRARGTDAPPEPELLGTPGFSAPERVQGMLTDARSDIFSLGVTLYAAIVGRCPFPNRTFKEALAAQLDWRPELAGALLDRAGPVVAGIIGRMLVADPDGRPQSARSIVLEILRRETVELKYGEDAEDERRAYARVLVEHLPFVDRTNCLARLLERSDQLALGEPEEIQRLARSVVIRAPEGLGKQRVINEFRREIQLSGGRFVGISCWSTDAGPLGIYGPAVVQLATSLSPKSPTLAVHRDLVQQAREGVGDPVTDSKIAEFLIAAAKERPYVLCLSDLDKADEITRKSIVRLMGALAHTQSRSMLCITAAPHAKVTKVLESLEADGVVDVWGLPPLTRDEMGQLVEALVGRTPSLRELVDLLESFTGGHPLGVRETLRALLEEAMLIRESDGWVLRAASTAATDLQEMLAQRAEDRLDRVGVGAWELASTLYLLEAPIWEERLAELTDLRRSRFQRLVERLEGEGLVVRAVVGTGRTTVALAHRSVREAVRSRCAESIDESRVELAERIDELEEDDAKLVYLRGKLLDDAAERMESVVALSAAADTLLDAGQTHLGAQLLERLIVRLRRHGGVDGLPQLLKATLTLLRRAAGTLEDFRREAAHYRAGIFVAELLGDHQAQALFWLGLADRFSNVQGESTESAMERLGHAAEAAELARDKILQLRIANRRAETLVQAGFVDQADRFSRDALELLDMEEAEDVDKLAVIGVRIRSLSFAGRLAQARDLHARGKSIAERVPAVQRQTYLSGVAFLGILGGDPQEAIPEILQAIEELREANTPRLLLSPLHNLGDLYLRSQELDDAAATFEEAIEISTSLGVIYHVHLNRGFLGYTLARAGRVDEGAVLLSRATVALQQLLGEHVGPQQLRLLQAEVEHMQGQTARARRQLEEMVAQFLAGNELSMANMAQDALTRIEHETRTAFIEMESGPVEAAGDPEGDTIKTRPVE